MNARSRLRGDAHRVAPELLGWSLTTSFGGVRTSVVISEVEAYEPGDPASHSFGGATARNRSMFAQAGTLYVYRSYGIHWCANVVTGPEGSGAAVLIRGGMPVDGIATMKQRRGRSTDLCNGPGKLCQALGITGDQDGVDLMTGSPIRLVPGTPVEWYSTPRVGISRATEVKWRFVADL